MSDKPILLVDIDGVISLFSFGLDARPAGVMTSVEGMPHHISATAGAHLLELAEDFEPAWCSGWEERANEHLPHLLGLPGPWPFLSFDRSPGRTRAHWKLDAIDAYAGQRPLAWIDDSFNEACWQWARERPAPTLLVQTLPAIGMTAEHVATLREWARGVCEGE